MPLKNDMAYGRGVRLCGVEIHHGDRRLGRQRGWPRRSQHRESNGDQTRDDERGARILTILLPEAQLTGKAESQPSTVSQALTKSAPEFAKVVQGTHENPPSVLFTLHTNAPTVRPQS
jgi:hypothetical protein